MPRFVPVLRAALVGALALTALPAARAQPVAPLVPAPGVFGTAAADSASAAVAARVRAEFQHAWRGYVRYAWGHDDLAPLSRAPSDWYAEPLLFTPVDALSTMLLMGLDAEADSARALIAERMSFDRDVSAQVFEITIRHLGGLLSAYQTTGDARLLALARDLGRRLLPAFDTPTGLPYRYVNLRTGAVRDSLSNPAETGTLLLEFGTLSKLTGDPVYYDVAKRALVGTFERRSALGLVGSRINVLTGAWTSPAAHISGGIDSYYEYLLKCAILFGDPDCRRMWEASIGPVNAHLADTTGGALWYGVADMHTGARLRTTYGALDAFMPALLALGGDVGRAAQLQASSYAMWRLHGIEPERLDYRTGAVVSAGYPLRPEILESAYVLHSMTGNPVYRAMGAAIVDDLARHCRTDAGYAALRSVVTKEQADEQPSFLFAETFKYAYLLFAPSAALDLSAVVLTTEAHPLRRTW